METSKDIKGQGAIRVLFGINMSKNEKPFYELFLDSLNPFDPSDLFDVSRTEYFSMLIDRLGNVGIAQFHSIQKASHRQGRTTQ
jgi:hypothetical protein